MVQLSFVHRQNPVPPSGPSRSKKNLELIGACKHEYLTAKKLINSDDKIIKTFWQRNPIRINPEEKEPNQGIYGIKIVKPGSLTYFYFSEGIEAQNPDALSRKVNQQFTEVEMIQECISRKKMLPKKIGISNPLVKIAYFIQIKLVQMSDDADYHEGVVLAECAVFPCERTMMKVKQGGNRCMFSNINAVNTAIPGLKCGVG